MIHDVVSPPGQVRTAAAIIAAEALALIVAGLILLAKTVFGHPDSLGRALFDAAFALCGAALLLAGARGLIRLRPAARTPVLVLQLLAIPVSYSLAFQADRVAYGGPILVAAVAVIYLLFTPPARAALDRDPPR
ncbi:MAG: hypothetical protein ACRDWT_08745 [Jatrophihabitantaceae bacterium]